MNHSTFTRPSGSRNLACCIAAVVGMTMMGNGSTSLAAFAQTAPPPTSSPSASTRSATARTATTRSTTARPTNRTAARPLPPVRTSTPKAALDEAQLAELRRGVDAIVFTSGSTVRNFLAAVADDVGGVRLLRRFRNASVHVRVASGVALVARRAAPGRGSCAARSRSR